MVWNGLVGGYRNRLFAMLFWAALSPLQFILGKIQVWELFFGGFNVFKKPACCPVLLIRGNNMVCSLA